MSKPRQNAVSPHLDAAAWDSISPIQVEDDSTLFSVTIPAPLIDCQTFLRASAGSERLFWAAPATNGCKAQFAGAGIAAELFVLPDIDGVSSERDPYAMIQQDAVRLLAGSRQFVAETGDEQPRPIDDLNVSDWPPTGLPRLFGGFSFQREFVPDNTWSVYHPAHFILPHFLLTETDEGTWLTIHATDQSGQQATDVALELLAAVRTRYTLLQDAAVERRSGTAVRHRDSQPSIRYPMSRADWFTLVDSATTKIAEGALQKVVLARVAEVRMESPIDPLDAIDYLLSTYPTCYRFMFEPVARPCLLWGFARAAG